MNLKDLKFEVIGIEGLEPGDFILVKYDDTKVDGNFLNDWAEQFFKPVKVRTCLVPNHISFEVVRAPAVEEESKKNIGLSPAERLEVVENLLNPVDEDGKPLEPFITEKQARKLLDGERIEIDCHKSSHSGALEALCSCPSLLEGHKDLCPFKPK